MEKVALTEWEMEMIAVALNSFPLPTGNWSEDSITQLARLAHRFEAAKSVTIEVEEDDVSNNPPTVEIE
jgi:hypothetical protein